MQRVSLCTLSVTVPVMNLLVGFLTLKLICQSSMCFLNSFVGGGVLIWQRHLTNRNHPVLASPICHHTSCHLFGVNTLHISFINAVTSIIYVGITCIQYMFKLNIL